MVFGSAGISWPADFICVCVCVDIYVHVYEGACTNVNMWRPTAHVAPQPGFEMKSSVWGLLIRRGWDCKHASPHLDFSCDFWDADPDPHACVVRHGRAISLLVLVLVL